MVPGKLVGSQASDAASAGSGGGSGAASATTICINSAGGAITGAGPSWRRAGKQVVEDDRTEEECAPIIVNLAKACGLAPVRLLAVGVFLSVLSITSERLVSYMKNVWRIRGHIDSLETADRRFILDFTSVGDYEHVTGGGPWRYQEDVVLVRKLEDDEDPSTVQFETVPIWVQFRGIPFYLLSKQLARNLGAKLGELICIDNDTRGDIGDKIIRARVHLPIARAL
jgi:hypothetical protein